MNEVRPPSTTPSSPPALVVRAAASPDTVDDTLPLKGEVLPQKEVPEADEPVEVDIKVAVTEINDYVQSIQRDLHFSVDEDSGMTVIRVRDKESGELIRQIPEDIFLNLAQKLKDNQALHLFDAHG